MPPQTASPYRWTDLPWLAGAALLYALLAKVVLTLYSTNGLVTIFWPGAGIALAALLLGGRKFVPVIYLGAFAGGVLTDHGIAESGFIALGSVLEPLLGAWLLTRKGSFDASLSTTADLFRLFSLAGIASPGVCALVGVGTLEVSGGIDAANAAREFALWWMGDTLGIVLVAPLVLTWSRPPRLLPGRAPEAIGLFALAFLLGQIIFLEWLSDIFGAINRGYWMYLVVSWAAVRFGLHGVLLVMLMTTVQALAGTAQGVGFFADDLARTHMVNFWAYTMILATVGTTVATLFAELSRAGAELRKLSLAVDQSPTSIVITDPQARIEYVNPAFSLVSGYTAAEAIGQKPSILHSGRTPRKTYEALWAALSQGRTWHGEFINRRKDGMEYIEEAVISPVRQADGTVSHYLAVKSDVTVREQTIALLHASEERLRLAQDAAGIGIYDYDLVGQRIACDERMRRLWGLGACGPIDGDTILGAVHPADRETLRVAIRSALDPAGPRRLHAEYRVVDRTDGQVRTIASTGQAFFEDGRAVRLVGTVLDVSERKHMEEEYRERRGEMEALLKQQVAAQTAAAIAHELNQPLVAISAYGEVALRALKSGPDKADKLARAVEGAVNQAQRAGRTLHELLDFLHKGEAECAELDINELIREAIAIAREDGHGGFNAQLDLEPGLRPVLGNRLQVQKVLVNLLHNGVEAMREAGVAVSAILIAVRTSACQTMAQVTVRDSGPGLDVDTARRVFEPFFTTKSAGIGLGLAISRALIEAHGGQLWIDPDAGPGATFHFTLPFAP